MGGLIQPGDILLWEVSTDSPFLDRIIGWGERKTGQIGSTLVNFYHVAIVGVDTLHFYDSQPGGVGNRDIPIPFPEYIEVYRFKDPLSATDLLKMWTYANSQKGKGYNYIGVLTAGLIEVWGKPFCSELVWRICTYAGRVICPWKTCLSPDDIAASDQLIRIQR